MKKSIILLLFAASTLSAQGKESKKNSVPTPRCNEFVGYSLSARLAYELRHPPLPHAWHRISSNDTVVCLRGRVA